MRNMDPPEALLWMRNRDPPEGLGAVGLGAERGGLWQAHEDWEPLGRGHRARRVRAGDPRPPPALGDLATRPLPSRIACYVGGIELAMSA